MNNWTDSTTFSRSSFVIWVSEDLLALCSLSLKPPVFDLIRARTIPSGVVLDPAMAQFTGKMSTWYGGYMCVQYSHCQVVHIWDVIWHRCVYRIFTSISVQMTWIRWSLDLIWRVTLATNQCCSIACSTQCITCSAPLTVSVTHAAMLCMLVMLCYCCIMLSDVCPVSEAECGFGLFHDVTSTVALCAQQRPYIAYRPSVYAKPSLHTD